MLVGLKINRAESSKAMRLAESAFANVRAAGKRQLLSATPSSMGDRGTCEFTEGVRAAGPRGVGANKVDDVNTLIPCSAVAEGFFEGVFPFCAEHVVSTVPHAVVVSSPTLTRFASTLKFQL